MDVFVVVPTQFLLLFHTPAPRRFLDIPILVLATDHETYLSARVGGDGGVGVFDGGKNFFARAFEIGDEGQVEPLVLSWKIFSGQSASENMRDPWRGTKKEEEGK